MLRPRFLSRLPGPPDSATRLPPPPPILITVSSAPQTGGRPLSLLPLLIWTTPSRSLGLGGASRFLFHTFTSQHTGYTAPVPRTGGCSLSFLPLLIWTTPSRSLGLGGASCSLFHTFTSQHAAYTAPVPRTGKRASLPYPFAAPLSLSFLSLASSLLLRPRFLSRLPGPPDSATRLPPLLQIAARNTRPILHTGRHFFRQHFPGQKPVLT